MGNRCAVFVHRDDMRQWQLATLRVQQQIQCVLDECGISAWCGGGTLLGAVRDDGFLYWDNDLDFFFFYRDYRRILFAFWKNRFLEKFDIYYNVNGYWERHIRLCELLSANQLDEELFDFELDRLSDTMFKVFAKETIGIRLWLSGSDEDENFIKIKHFTAIHLTRERLARIDENIQDGKVYEVFPNVCMLPMLVISFGAYLRSQYLYLLYRNLINLAESWKAREKRIFTQSNDYAGPGSRHVDSRKFDPAPYESNKKKVGLALRNIMRANFCFFINGVKWFMGKRASGEYIVYKQGFFRFQVLPCSVEFVLPLKKMSFEGVEINIPRNPEAVLINQFGNYRIRPSIVQRVAYPFFIKERTS